MKSQGDKQKKVEKGTMLSYSNHAGKHTVEYLYEIEDGVYTTMVGKWNGFDKPVKSDCFRYMGVIQSSWKII